MNGFTLNISRTPLKIAGILFFMVVFCRIAVAQQARTTVELRTEMMSIPAGGATAVALHLVMPDHWYTYWENPGQAGMPTSIEWSLPEGFQSDPLQWPVPSRFGEGEFTTYGYSGTADLLTRISVNQSVPPGSYTLNASVSWLECDELCIPGQTQVQAQIQVAPGDPVASANPDYWVLAKSKLIGNTSLQGQVEWLAIEESKREFLASIHLPDDITDRWKPDFFPAASPQFDTTMDHLTRKMVPGELLIKGSIYNYESQWPEALSGLLVLHFTDSGIHPQGYSVQLLPGSIEQSFSAAQSVEQKAFSNPITSGILGNSPWSTSGFPPPVAPPTPAAPDKAVSVVAPDNDTADSIPNPIVSRTDSAPVPPTTNVPQVESAVEVAPLPRASSGIPTSLAFVFAFLGGIILNFMPCVLPVVFLKIMSFVKLRESEPRKIRSYGIFYLLGVLACYLVLALILIGLRASGKQMGFGFQFTSPYFVLALTVLTTLIALNLFGVFEIILGGKTTTAAGKLSTQSGNMGAFWGGCFTTLLGTPCMAPGISAAAGVALSTDTPPLLMILLFLTMGVGLALPYVLASFIPGFIRILPKPGNWMHYFKVSMGFPMAAASIWLLTLNEIHYGKSGILWVGMFLVAVSLLVWVYGNFIQKATRGQGMAWFVISAGVLATYTFILEGNLDWRHPSGSEASTSSISTQSSVPFDQLMASAGIQPDQADPAVKMVLEKLAASYNKPSQSADESLNWQPWSLEAIQLAQSQGRPVFVDFTATWCINCKENKKRAIDIDETRSRLQQMNAVLLKADYTRQPEHITRELQKFGRAGVPLNLIYPADPTREPIVLPTKLTRENVLGALDKITSL